MEEMDAGPEVEGKALASPRSLLQGPVPVVSWQQSGLGEVGFSCLTHVWTREMAGTAWSLKNPDLETLRSCGWSPLSGLKGVQPPLPFGASRALCQAKRAPRAAFPSGPSPVRLG